MNVNADLIFDLFRIRSDIHGKQNGENGEKVDKPFDFTVLIKHTTGIERIGCYSTKPINNTIKWICVDFDPEYHSIEESIKFIKICQYDFNLTAHLERSKSGGGHVWFFFNGEVPAWKGRRVMQYILLTKMGLKASNSNSPDSVEVFPKQDSISEDGFGNFVYLPFNGKSMAEGKTLFVDYNNGLNPYPDQMAYLKGVKRISEQDLNRIISKFNIDSTLQVYERKSTPFTEETSKSIKEKREKLLPCAKKVLEQGVDEGQRDCVSFALAKHLKRAGYTEKEAELELMEWNGKNRPPLAEYIVSDKIRQAEKYDSLDCEGAMSQWCDKANCSLIKKKEKVNMQNEIKPEAILQEDENNEDEQHILSKPFPDKSKYPGYENVNIDIVRKTVEMNFPHRWPETEACLSVISTLLLKDIVNPSSINLIGDPSSEKTTVLSFFYGLEGITYKSDKFTPKCFVSHSANVARESLPKIDLLPQIRAKTLVVPDLIPLFGHRVEDLLENMSTLTRVFDGDGLKTNSGVHGGRGYEGDYMFCWLGASTPIPNKVWSIMGNLGTRFMFLLMPDEEDSYEDDVKTLTIEKPYKIKCKEVRDIMHKFLVKLWVETGGFRSIKWDRGKDSEELIGVIVRVAHLLTKLRGTTSVWKKERNVGGEEDTAFKSPIIERRKRAMTILHNITRGRAIIHGRRQILAEDLYLTIKIALSSAPQDRCKVLTKLIEKGQYKSLTLSEIKNILKCTNYMAENVMDTLEILGLVKICSWTPEEGGSSSKKIVLEGQWHWVFEDPYSMYFMKGNVDEQSKKNDTVQGVPF